MSEDVVRFIHASDLHLEQPAHGLTEAPEHLRGELIDAPLQAAQRIFETALLEGVDFVVLSGDIINPRTAGPHAIALLLEQLELLREQHIAVYWAGGHDDTPDGWPEELRLPDNVHSFPKGQVKQVVHLDGDQPVATILGVSSTDGQVHAGDFRTEPTNRYTVAVAYGDADAVALAGHKQIDYWALGGLHQAKTLFQSPQIAHYAGTPQGRAPDEDGVHGCLLVTVDRGRKARTKFIPTDTLRWRSETLALEDTANRNELQRQLRSRMQRIATEAGGCTGLVSWQITTAGTLAGALRTGGLDRELLEWLRTEFGRAKPPVWTIALEADSPATLPEESYTEDTILGDFLRAVRAQEQERHRPFLFTQYLPDLSKNRALAAVLESADGDTRESLLQEATLLGADLLRGEVTL
jgi:3',5'-cyclic AMP phosphodiesterase CpdA